MDTLANDREAMTRKLKAIRMGAAEISQLLASGTLTDDDWDRAALILVSCRRSVRRWTTICARPLDGAPRPRRIVEGADFPDLIAELQTALQKSVSISSVPKVPAPPPKPLPPLLTN